MNTINYILPNQITLKNNTYKILQRIGEGGFGITYLAEQIVLGSKVVIKELFISGNCVRQNNNTVSVQSISNNQYLNFKKRFIEEGRTLARFKHRHIVKVTDIFEENNTVYLVMDYIEGGNLKEKIEREGKLSESLALKYIRQIGNALNTVHQKGFLHRDIKPSNIMLSKEDDAILIDFGIAKEYIREGTQSNTGSHTPGYAPIEQYSLHTKLGTYTDIYALGATLYFCLTGTKPMDAVQRYENDLVLPQRINPSISDETNTVILKAMELKTKNRYQSIEDFLKELNLNLPPIPLPTPKPPTPEFSIENTIVREAEPILPKTDLSKAYLSEPSTPESNIRGYVYGWLLFIFSILILLLLATKYVGDNILIIAGFLFLILPIVIGRKRRAIIKGIETFLYWMTGCIGYWMIFITVDTGERGAAILPLLFTPPMLVGILLNYYTKKVFYYVPFLIIALLVCLVFGAIYSEDHSDFYDQTSTWFIAVGYFLMCVLTPLWWENKFKDLKV